MEVLFLNSSYHCDSLIPIMEGNINLFYDSF